MMPTIGDKPKKALPKKQSIRTEGVRVAKARLCGAIPCASSGKPRGALVDPRYTPRMRSNKARPHNVDRQSNGLVKRRATAPKVDSPGVLF
jgi:hypothetical protein